MSEKEEEEEGVNKTQAGRLHRIVYASAQENWSSSYVPSSIRVTLGHHGLSPFWMQHRQ